VGKKTRQTELKQKEVGKRKDSEEREREREREREKPKCSKIDCSDHRTTITPWLSIHTTLVSTHILSPHPKGSNEASSS
jgi:hypothetical protein